MRETLDGLYEPILWLYLVMALVTFVPLFWIAAPYGRFTRKGWGPQISALAGWIIMEFPAVAALPVYCLLAGGEVSLVGGVFLAMWLSHYVHRTFVYPFRHRRAGATMPVLIVGMAIFFNLVNGFANGWFVFGRMDYGAAWLVDPRFVLGLALFVVGMAINVQSDQVLLRIKRKGEGYQIPQSGLHRYVASPNYFGEILEWTGWALATWSPAGALFALYTIANLAPRARSNLLWYRRTFADYPADRKALIPGIW